MAEEKSSYKSEEIGKTYSIFGKYEGIENVLSQINSTTVSLRVTGFEGEEERFLDIIFFTSED